MNGFGSLSRLPYGSLPSREDTESIHAAVPQRSVMAHEIMTMPYTSLLRSERPSTKTQHETPGLRTQPILIASRAPPYGTGGNGCQAKCPTRGSPYLENFRTLCKTLGLASKIRQDRSGTQTGSYAWCFSVTEICYSVLGAEGDENGKCLSVDEIDSETTEQAGDVLRISEQDPT
jgi:hypothetical protein